MRLVSIINLWIDTIEFLDKCVENHLSFSDGVIVVYSRYSNHFNEGLLHDMVSTDSRITFVRCEPERGLSPIVNETRKRNQGIQQAIQKGFTHYFIADTDEFYDTEEATNAKQLFYNTSIRGLVCGLKVYIGKPTLWCEDHTLVPFIHVLSKDTYVGNFREYPFAYNEHGIAQIDPSRRPNDSRGIEMCSVIMHHFSYVRKDIDLKIDNSSANLRRSREAIKRDISNAAPGYKVTFGYNKELQECTNYFGL